MLKYVATLGGLAGFAYVLFLMTGNMKPAEEQDRLLAIGFAPAAAGEVKTHVVVTDLMYGADPPDRDKEGADAEILWPERHLEFSPAALSPMSHQGSSQIISGQDAGTARIFVETSLKAGEKYLVTYRPKGASGPRFVGSFTSPTQTTNSLQRVTLVLKK